MFSNINEILLNHFSTGGGGAAYLRGIINDFSKSVNKLFLTRSDIQRVQIAEKISEQILKLSDFNDIIPLRDEVATLEINRLLTYGKQTDHTVHTLYMFLLGVWIYDNIPILRSEIDKSINSKKPIKMFIFQWIFASLLHDVGYLFFNYETVNNNKSWEVFDRMFTFSYIKENAGKLSNESNEKLIQVYDDFSEEYGNSLCHSKLTKAKNLLDQLNFMPWNGKLISGQVCGLDILRANFDKNNILSEFAYKIATIGYDDKKIEPEVDHAIASGLMLLKYTSLWYWMCKSASKKDDKLSAELNCLFRYPEEVLQKHVIPACRAVIYHNITGIQVRIDDQPLLYLAILCDELQFWDRFLSGHNYVENWKSVQHCMAEQVFAEIVHNDKYGNQLHFYLDGEKFSKIKNKIDEKLVNWENIIQLSYYS